MTDIEPQKLIDSCLDCQLPECVYVDPAIDRSWCSFDSDYGKLKLVGYSRKAWFFGRPSLSVLGAIKRHLPEGGCTLKELVSVSGISYQTLLKYIGIGWLETSDKHPQYILGVKSEPSGGKVLEYVFSVRSVKSRWVVAHYPLGSSDSRYCFESENPYLAIAAIAMEMAKRYGKETR